MIMEKYFGTCSILEFCNMREYAHEGRLNNSCGIGVIIPERAFTFLR